MAAQAPLVPGTLFRAPDGELYLILDEDRTKITKVSKDLEAKVKDLLDQYFLPEEPWLAAVHGGFFYPLESDASYSLGRPVPPCCAAQHAALKEALEAWQKKQRK